MKTIKTPYFILLKAFLGVIVLFYGCTGKQPVRTVTRAFYYWKSSLIIDQPSVNLLHELHVQRMYVKFFDVLWNEQAQQPIPVAVVKFQQPAGIEEMEIIPTVFITNECMEKMDTARVTATAEKILLLIRKICNANNLNSIPEIQVDCDWNAVTRSKYFALLNFMRHRLSTSKIQLSATIRLYQCKYAEKAGIPPVDRGLIMCYNMGNLKNPSTVNSILEVEELNKYISGLSAYPLPLDVALPLFEWKVLFRNNRYKGLITELPTSLLLQTTATKRSGNRYTVLYDTTLNGYDLRVGDMLRDEQVEFDELVKAVDLITARLKTKHLAVSLYHLDSLTLSKYSIHELETIFDHFR